MKKLLPILLLGILVFSFFIPSLIRGNLPIPSDTIVGLYHPFRDLYADEYPNGIPFKNFLLTDPVRQQYPWKLLAISQEKSGDLPLWNPYAFAGYPLLGNVQSGAFYGFNVLFFLLPFSWGWTMYIWLQPILGSIFLYLYLRNLKLSSLAAVLGGFVFAYSGFAVAWLEWGNILHTAIWLPLVLLSIDKVFGIQAEKVKSKYQIGKIQIKNQKELSWLLLFIFSLSSSFFAGHLQTFFYLFLVSFSYLFFRWTENRSKGSVLFLFIICFLIFTIITLPQWLPTLQFLSLSARSIDQADWHQAGWFLPWQNLIQFLAPDFFGNPSTLNYFGVWNYGEFIGYVGIFPLLLSFFALGYRRDKITWFYGIVVVLSLLFALPTIVAKLPFLFSLPFISTAQPTRLLFLVDFSLAVLTALGLDYFQKKDKHMLYPLFFLLLLFVLIWGVTLFFPSLVPGLGENFSVAKRNLQLPTLLFFGIFMITVILLKTKNDRLRILLLLALFMLTVADISRFAGKFTPFTKPEYLYPNTKALNFLQKNLGEGRFMSLDSRILPPNFSSLYRLQSIEGYDPLYLSRYAELITASERKHVDVSQPIAFHRIITPHEPNSPIIDLLGVRYVLTLSDISYPQLKKAFQEGQTRVYENERALPRAFFVTAVTASNNNKEKILSFLLDSARDLHQEAIAEDLEDDKAFSSGSAVFNQYSPNRVLIQTQNTGEGFLVLTDAYYPTWKARLLDRNGTVVKDLPIFRTDYAFRGVIVPPGAYIVEFKNSLF